LLHAYNFLFLTKKYSPLKKLDIYIIKKFLGTFFFSITLLIAIIVIFDVSEHIEKYIENAAPLNEIIFDYYVNWIPFFVNQFGALFTFIAVILFTSKMAANSEIIAILSSGISFRRLLFPYFISALIIGIMSYGLASFVIPHASKKRLAFWETYIGKTFRNKERNIHRQITPGTYIYMSSFNVSRGKGYNFAMDVFDGNKIVSKLNSREIIWNEELGKWTIHKYKIRTFDGDKESMESGVKLDTLLAFTKKEFSTRADVSETMTTPELSEYIDLQKMRGSSSVVQLQIEKYKRLSSSFATFILTLIGVSLSARKIRGGIGMHLGIGLGLSFSYILFQQLSSVFATNGDMDPLLAVWIPNIMYSVIAIYLYIRAPK
jgi:lipopolysaccharide export system permease protein